MIKLESVHIEWARGIAHKLDLDFAGKNFAISGPNGSGKSAVIDALEFALTGQIGRLSGSGTKGLSVTEHGPHVDKTKFPDAAYVRVGVTIPSLGKSATITRKFKTPTKVEIEPQEPDIATVLAEVAEHPEITLSRRDIIRFILVEPSKRSEEIQTLLKLDSIGDTRSSLFTAQNRLQSSQRNAKAEVMSASDTLKLHLQLEELNATTLLDAVNKKRELLGLPVIAELTPSVEVDDGIATGGMPTEFNKESALRDLNALGTIIQEFATLGREEASEIVRHVSRLEADPSLLAALQKRSFIEKGLDLVDGAECPLCDVPWDDEEHLKHHLEAKLAKSEEARQLRESLLNSGGGVSAELVKILGVIAPVRKLADAESDQAFARILRPWKEDLEDLKEKLRTVDGLTSLRERLAHDWICPPGSLTNDVDQLTRKVKGVPDQSSTVNAQTFLTTAQLRLNDYRAAMRTESKAKVAANAAKIAYDRYCEVAEDALNNLYKEVEADFSTFYRELNQDDENTFAAQFTPSEGKLDLDVNFYDRGLFPPGAYHSEGHQDAMGVCLYLALMKRLFGDQFSLALFDDVVMSVDSGHRYQFCRLLKSHFPDTQFIITTHDRLWAEQMKSAGVVTAKGSVVFHSWSIDTGPLVESGQEIWGDIEAALTKGKVEVAAAALRQHLEYACRHLADQLGASPRFRADGNYELGELLPSVLSRVDRLLGKAVSAAQTWGHDADQQAALDRRSALKACKGASSVEQWAVNKAVHYNEWGNFGKMDFQPVVTAFKALLDLFQCGKCGSWIYVSPRSGNAESLRCPCNDINFNLKSEQK